MSDVVRAPRVSRLGHLTSRHTDRARRSPAGRCSARGLARVHEAFALNRARGRDFTETTGHGLNWAWARWTRGLRQAKWPTPGTTAAHHRSVAQFARFTYENHNGW